MKKGIMISALMLLSGIFAYSQSIVKDSLDFAKAYASGVTDILEGQVSSVILSGTDGGVNSCRNLFIRGLNTIHGDSQPAVFVDGTLLNSAIGQNLDAFYDKPGSVYMSPLNSLGFMSMYDIESIEVIKDVSATALYGTVGANGVVLIHTRQDKPGKNIGWHSNVFSDFRRVSHNHDFRISNSDKGISYNVSGFFRSNNGETAGNGNNTGGLAIRFAAKSSPYVWFTFNTFTSVGKAGDMAQDFEDNSKDFRSVNNADLTINFLKVFKLDFNLGFDMESNNRSIWYGDATVFGSENNGAASVMESTLFGYNAKADLNFRRYLGAKHLLNADLFFGADGNANKFNAMCGYDFFVHDLRAKGLSIMGSDPRLHKYQRTYGEMSGGAKLSYSYDGKLGVDAAMTLGYNSKYDETPSYFPTANVWVDLHSMLFGDFKPVSALKLTAGFGSAGREYFIPYELTGMYYTGAYPSVKRGAETYYDSLNRLLTTEWNAGIEFGLMGNRLNAAVKYYDRTTADDFSMYCFGQYSKEAKLWAYGDRYQAFSNVDRIRNRGFELDLAAVLVDNRDFKWTLSLNGAYNVNQIVGSNGDNINGRSVYRAPVFNANVLGYSVGSLIGFREDAAGNYLDLFKDGNIDNLDRTILGSTVPEFSGGFNTCLQYRRFSLDVMARGVEGVSIANLERMAKDGKRFLSQSYVEDGSYFRLGRVSLSYDIPFKADIVKSMCVSMTAINPLTLTKYSGNDPDVNCFGDSVLTIGADYGSYKAFRGFLIGISARF